MYVWIMINIHNIIYYILTGIASKDTIHKYNFTSLYITSRLGQCTTRGQDLLGLTRFRYINIYSILVKHLPI